MNYQLLWMDYFLLAVMVEMIISYLLSFITHPRHGNRKHHFRRH